MAVIHQLLWSLIGLLLTIGGTFLEVYVTSPPWNWSQQGIQAVPLSVTFQIGAVLLVSCLGGKNAAALSQIAYLILGLSWLPVFTLGGGLGYLRQPHFGYLLGFIPGAWICGFLAFLAPPKLESLAFSCICGLLTIHIFGLSYLVLGHIFNWTSQELPLIQLILKYSFYALPEQLAVVCAITVVAYVLRHILFY